MRRAARRTLARQHLVVQSEVLRLLAVRPSWFVCVSAAAAQPAFRAAFLRARSGPFRLTLPLLSNKVAKPSSHSEEAVNSKDPPMSESRKRSREGEPTTAAIKACSRTQEELDELRARIKKSELDEKDYFFTNFPGTKKHPPRNDLDDNHVRCKECGCTIDEHAAAPGAAKPKSKSYEEALELVKSGGAVAAPQSGSQTLIGRHGFAEKIHDLALVKHSLLMRQCSFSLLLQNVSGVGKTFATITARRALMELARRKGLAALDYEPVVVYLGLSQNFQLQDDERAALQPKRWTAEYVMRSVLFQRLNFTLHHTLEAIKAKGSVAAALDSEDPSDWRQRLAQPKASLEDYQFCADIADINDNGSLIVKLCNEIQKLAWKKLVVLAVLDDVHVLDTCIPPNTGYTGGARFALQVLRELQVTVNLRTEGRVKLLPIATSVDAQLSLEAVGQTFGENKIVGSKPGEALTTREDFVTLAHTFLKGRVAAENIPVFAQALYPHVREIISFADTGKFPPPPRFTMPPEAVQKLVVAAFLGDTRDFSAFPVQSIPHLPASECDGTPVPSFLVWQTLNDCLKERLAHPWPLPFPEIRAENAWSQCLLTTDFETRLFDVLAYFLAVFGPVLQRITDYNIMTVGGAVTKWLPFSDFPVVLVKRLANSQGQCNPSTSPSLDGMASRDLAADFVSLVQEALEICAEGKNCAVWVHCGGKAPLDFLLLGLRPDKTVPKRVEVMLRFADAKHATYLHLQDKAKLFDEMHRKAKHLREVLVKKLPRITDCELDFSQLEEYHNEHLMLCHSQPDADFFSPSTFTWSPWSQLLFLTPQASAVASQGATGTSAGKQVGQCPVEKEQDH